jgi:hypothetical protein
MSLADLVKAMVKPETGNAAACRRYRAKNIKACRARVRASKLKAKGRKA